MAQKINLKISQRHDVLSNWTSNDPILLDGELIAVECQDQTRFKLGNGVKKFSELDYVDEKTIESQRAKFGTSVVAAGTGSFAHGFSAQANADYSTAGGYKAKATHMQSFVWSGQTGNDYESKGQGTFAIDPVSGISGVFVGMSSLYAHLCSHTFPLSSKTSSLDNAIRTLSGEVETISAGLDTRLAGAQKAADDKIWLDGISATSLSIQHVSQDDYHKLVLGGAVLSNCLYVVSAESKNMYGQKIEHMADGAAADDAATVGQVASVSSTLTAYAPTSTLTAYAQNATVDALPTSAEVSTMLTSYSYGKTDVDGLSAKYAHLSASRYKLVDATLTPAGSGLSCAVADQTVTRIVISSSSTPVSVQLPPRPTGNYLSSGARDFVMRIEVSVSAVPTVTFFGGISGSGYEPVSFDAEDDSWCVLEQGLNIISFTETKRA